jgi:hypothetical protein
MKPLPPSLLALALSALFAFEPNAARNMPMESFDSIVRDLFASVRI